MESKFESICTELLALHKAKNVDYADSFSKSVKEFGLTAALIPITNKVNRLKKLIKSDSLQVKDESIDDTLKDLACYAIMTLAERKQYTLDEIWSSFREKIASLEELLDNERKEELHRKLDTWIIENKIGFDTKIVITKKLTGNPSLSFKVKSKF